MFKNQPRGLLAAALANMGERFGFYIMMAILSLFISAKFGLDVTSTGYIYSAFYASIYLLALVGGIIADRTKKYKQTILWGIILMAVGYLIIAVPTPTPVPSKILYLTLTCFGLLVIAFGNGLFLQILLNAKPSKIPACAGGGVADLRKLMTAFFQAAFRRFCFSGCPSTSRTPP